MECPVCGSSYTVYNMKLDAWSCEDCAHWFDGNGVLEHPIECKMLIQGVWNCGVTESH